VKLLAIDLFCGLGGWTDGLLAEGWNVIGFDIEQHIYGEQKYPAQLVLQDVLTLHGSQFRNADLIVASPPCQRYSYMAMPWSRAKAQAAEIRADESGEKLRELNALFEACFRLQREASEAAGRHIPMVVENVIGAQKWVGSAAWHYGSFYLWGDVPAIMPSARLVKVPGMNFHDFEKTGQPGRSFQSAAVKTVGHANIRDGYTHTRHLTNQLESDAVKQHGSGAAWFDMALDERRKEATGVKGNGGGWYGNYAEQKTSGRGCASRQMSSHSPSRKAASAQIAKIPFELACYIAQVYKPVEVSK
jgi:C-5 cytosine-specific DNA methylase